MPSTVFRLCLILCTLQIFAAVTFAADQNHEEAGWTAKKAVQYAVQNNPDIRIAGIRITAAQAKIEQADSRLFPSLQLNTEYSQTDNPMYSFGNILNQGAFDATIDFNDPGRTDSLLFKAELQYRLYSGGSDSAAQDAAHHDHLVSTAEYSAVINQLSFEVVRSFEQILLAENMIEARKSALHALQSSLQVARARHAAGDLLRPHLLDLEVQEARAEEDLIQALHTLTLTHHAFNNLLGRAEGPVLIDRQPRDTVQLLPQARDYGARPELQSIAAAVASARSALQMARAAYLPVVDGFAGYQYENGFITNGDGDAWIGGIRMSYSLFDGGRKESEVALRAATVAELEETKRKTELLLNYELQQAEHELEQAGKRVTVTAKMVQLARESAELSRARFQEGVLLSSELIDIETRLTEALLRDSRAQALYRIAAANLRKVVGLPQFE